MIVEKVSNVYLLVACEGIPVDLHSAGGIGGISSADLVQAQQLAGRIIKLVMVELEGCQRGVKRKLYVRGKRSVLHLA